MHAHGDLGLAFGQIEPAIRHDEIDAKLGVFFLEGLDHRRQEPGRHAFGTGHPQRATEFLVPRRHMPLERRDGSLDLLRVRDQRSAELRQPIAGRVLLDKLAADALLERAEATLHGWLADAESLRRRKRTTLARDRQEIAQVVPVEHARTQHFCRTSGQTCG
jgi:hypothetical protein